jgi:ArsR family transcriptional regulator
MVLTLIQEGEQHVSALCNRLNQLQPAVSFHLGRMFRDGILRRRRQGKFCYYSLAPHFLRESLAPFFANGQDQIRVADLVLSLS